MCNLPVKHWPDDQLESVDRCPVCGGFNNRLLEPDLVDWSSNPPTGFWEMRSCVDCGIAYLSPRPDINSIKNAYCHYYTHTSDKDDLIHTGLRAIKDYFAEKYFAAASKTGGFLDYIVYVSLRVLYPVSLYFDAKSRYIFKVKGKTGRLLDIGCGNGEFLRFANRYGWNVVGVDFDEHAVNVARSGGLDVRTGGIEVIDVNEKFDFISLNHVIEHVYDPVKLIESCYALLNDGGTLWLETPNIESMGYALYKSNWRGLEPPRHIMLFNETSLNKMLLKSGFVSVVQKNHALSGVYMGMSSERLLNKTSPCSSITACGMRKMTIFLKVISLEIIQLLSKKRREYITLLAFR